MNECGSELGSIRNSKTNTMSNKIGYPKPKNHFQF